MTRPEHDFLLSGVELCRLMRPYHVTIRTLAQRLQVPMKRLRFRRAHGFNATETVTVRDWIEALTGTDPGPQPS